MVIIVVSSAKGQQARAVSEAMAEGTWREMQAKLAGGEISSIPVPTMDISFKSSQAEALKALNRSLLNFR